MVAPVDVIACQLARSNTYVIRRATSRSRFVEVESRRFESGRVHVGLKLLRRRRGFGDRAWTLSDNAAAEEMWNVGRECSILLPLVVDRCSVTAQSLSQSVGQSVSQSICCPQRGQHKMMSAAYRQRKACRGIVQLIQNRAEGRRWGCYVWTEQWPGQNSKLQVRTHAVQVCGRGAAQWTPNFLAVQQPSGPNGTQLDPLSKPSTPPRRWHVGMLRLVRDTHGSSGVFWGGREVCLYHSIS